jgi:hypothetical protein
MKKNIIHHNNSTYEFKDEAGYYHLVSNGVDLLKDKRATELLFYKDGIYQYKNKDGLFMIQNEEDLLNYSRDAIFVRWLAIDHYIYISSDGTPRRIGRALL